MFASKFGLVAIVAALVFTLSREASAASGAGQYYKEHPHFHYFPDPKAKSYTIHRLGPLGFGVELRQPAFTMHVLDVEAGSPAAKTGKLKKGQIVESINGEVLKDIDPRVQLGNLITRIEATDGIARLMVRDTPNSQTYPVTIEIPVLGPYSDTWPVNCSKSDKIVRDFANFLARVDKPSWGAPLFLLSTGDERDLAVVRRWFHNKLPADMEGFPWSIGYTGPAICEYYLRTGDTSVLPAIKSLCDTLTRTIYNGSWMGRGGVNYDYMSGGHMNAAGVHCVTFLLLAKECGVDVDPHTLQSSLLHIYRYAGHNNVSYGDGLPEGGFSDNGKTGGLAFTMAAAASLTPEGEGSVYASARDISATKSFYSTSWLFHGHTGGGIGEIWRGAAMGLVREKRPVQYQSFMDERRWIYELSRCHDGAFGISAGSLNVGYAETGHEGGRAWGNYFPLVYTVPRKQLRMFGAPPTPYSKPHQLPTRPWGTAADEMFYSLKPAEQATGSVQDISKEMLRTDASMPVLFRVNDEKVSDETLLMYVHHIDQGVRAMAAGAIAKQGRFHLIVPLLKSNDPRVRHAGLLAIAEGSKKMSAADVRLTDEMFELVAGMVKDPAEAWWVVEAALNVLAKARPERIAQSVDRLTYWLEHDEWWLRKAAMVALTPVAADTRFYRRVLPIIGKMIVANERAVALSPVGGIVKELQTAEPEVQRFGVEVLAKAYSDFPTTLMAPGGQDMSDGVSYLLHSVATDLAAAPGGFDELFRVSRQRFPEQSLPHQDLVMEADASSFGPELREALKPLVLEKLIPEFIGASNHVASNRDLLMQEASSSVPFKGNFYYRHPRMDELVGFYNRIGIDDYNWHDYGSERSEIKWEYHSFDPPETLLWKAGTRYRDVTFPLGMESWYLPSFDATAAGWNTGQAPFGQFDGKLAAGSPGCHQSFCNCSEPAKTLWEHEVLLMRAKVQYPPFREDCRYRLVVGGMSHNLAGDGFRIYVNGKLMQERKRGAPKRSGGAPVCYYIDKAWWPAFEKEVNLAAISFLPIPGGKRSPGVKKNYFAIWVQEMKVPPLDEEEIMKLAADER